jgi:glycogen operon protein
MHVRDFTRNPNSGVLPGRRGTFAGVIDKIPYLKELGITIVELLPVRQLDPQEGNYWGYMPLNFFCLLLLANGVPMFAAGDEFHQTPHGNNNPYSQDNETTWLDRARKDLHADQFRFEKWMVAFRKAHPSIGRSGFWRDDVRWYGVGPFVDLSFDSHSVAYCLHRASRGDRDLYVMIDAYHEPLEFEVQESPAGGWRRAVDTGLESPVDIAEQRAEPVVSLRYRALPRSVVALLGGEGRS